MTKIGILAPNNSTQIVNALVMIFKSDRKVVAVKKNNPKTDYELNFLDKSGIKYALIIFNEKKIYPVELDVLILDNEQNSKLVSYDLVECMSEKTILIYNTDNGFLPHINHPNAIDYGYNPTSSVTISSVNHRENSISFIVSIQREICGMFDNILPIGEILINSKYKAELCNLLSAVICSLVCGIINYAEIKI